MKYKHISSYFTIFLRHKPNMTTIILLTLMAINQHLQGQTSVPLSPAFLEFQADAPMQVVATRISIAHLDLLDQVTLVNVSDRKISGYTLGWVLEDQSTGQYDTPHVGSPQQVDLDPDGVTVAKGQGVDIKTQYGAVRSRGFSNPRVVVGVVHIRFADGAEWAYALQSRGRFEEKQNPSLKQRLQPILQKHMGSPVASAKGDQPKTPTRAQTCTHRQPAKRPVA